MKPLINDNHPLTPAETAQAADRASALARSVTGALRRLMRGSGRHHAIYRGGLTPAMRRDLGLDPSWSDTFPNVRSGITPFDGIVLGAMNDNARDRRRVMI